MGENFFTTSSWWSMPYAFDDEAWRRVACFQMWTSTFRIHPRRDIHRVQTQWLGVQKWHLRICIGQRSPDRRTSKASLARAEQKPVSLMMQLPTKFCLPGHTNTSISFGVWSPVNACLLAPELFKLFGSYAEDYCLSNWIASILDIIVR